MSGWSAACAVVFNVMRQLGMLPGEVEKPPQQYVVDNTHGHHRNLVLLRPREGGLLMPEAAINARASFDGQPDRRSSRLWDGCSTPMI